MIDPDLARSVFCPRTIALVGASTDPTKYASLAQRYLRAHGYDGELFPINPRADIVFGEKAYPTVGAIGHPVDHAFISLPTALVLASVQDCAAAGVRCATILSNGFAEVGKEGARLQEEIVSVARAAGMRLLGPNSMGLVNISGHVALSVNEVLSLPELQSGRYGLISQSGSLIGALISRGHARGIGFSKLISVGNEADLGVSDLGHMLIDDPDTDAILLFLETVRRAPDLRRMAARAYEAGKPVVAFRLGRSAVGSELAASHTGAIAGDSAALDAFLQDCGIVCVRQLETLFEIPPLLIGRRPPQGRRVAVMTTTGGGGGLVVDSLGDRGIDVVAPGKAIIGRLSEQGVPIGQSPLIDLTLAGANPATYGLVLGELALSGDYDVVVPVVGSSAQFRPDRAIRPIVDQAARGGAPMAVFMTPQADRSLALLHEAGIAGFRTPESCADAIAAYLNWRAPHIGRPEARDLDAVEEILSDPCLSASDMRKAFGALGVPQTAQILLAAPACRIPPDIADRVRFPVAVKIVSPDILHKTEAGGVMLGVPDEAALDQACRQILRNAAERVPDARIEGVQVESMERGLAEVLVGYRLDSCVGPTVAVGVGGILAEIYHDAAVRMAPVDRETALAMIEEVRGLAPIRGYRNMPVGDLDALANVICAVSELARVAGGIVSEAEINPVIVKRMGEGVVAVDAVIVTSATPRH